MPTSGLLIGPHLQLGHGLIRASDRARAIGACAVQVFTDNPTAWRRRTELPEEHVGYDATNLERALLLADGQALPELPPEAFSLRRGAARSGPASA